ncbi:hypothetical protein Rt10032_c01g0206 [Rhodotorula toruloides]|uniref:Uncharacterized protein n=1 Tax=Rhodotorula toruloides TaxID=5286 RepID=A0A511K773_RHOTO|nr:hypothetical protein Rt10032_c01g0206 [Rhodotorula toruloides]
MATRIKLNQPHRSPLHRRQPVVSTPSSSDESDWSAADAPTVPPAVPPEDPIDPLRRMNTVLEFAGAGALCIGSALVVSLYVTGPPRLKDYTSDSTAVLLMLMISGGAACIPSWAAALLILFGKKPAKDEPPRHRKLLRSAALASLFLAVLQCVAGIILYVLLEGQESFVDFCLKNMPTAVPEDCVARWDRNWVIVLAVSLVLVYHIALGFPVYRYTRDSDVGKRFDDIGNFLELASPTSASRHSGRRSSLSLFDSDSDSSLARHMLEEAKRPFHSPGLVSTSHFSTLPPTPPSSFPPSPPLIPSVEDKPVNSFRLSSTANYPTPPASAPGSARWRSKGFDTALEIDPSASAGIERQNSRSSSILLGEDLRDDKDPSAKRRPSLILTSAPTEEPQGLAIGIDMGDGGAPAPLMQRSFSGSTSPLHSPIQPHFSTSPLNSPALSALPSPLLAAGSAFPGSSSMERAPSSPRLASLTGFASGLVRRASSNSLNAELPTSIKSAPTSPTVPSIPSPSLSPSLGVPKGPIRRTSFASAAREEERKKEKEAKDREEKKRIDKFRHNRGFSWAVRPDDPHLKKARADSAKSGWRRRLLILFVVSLVGFIVAYYRSSGASDVPLRQTFSQRAKSSAQSTRATWQGAGTRARMENGHFIHPDVVERRQAPSSRWIGAPYRWVRRFFVVDGPSRTPQYRQPPMQRKSEVAVPEPTDKAIKEKKRHNVFVARPHVEFVDHEALPPPVEHGDAPERDTLVLYRILGNDLPPRHSPGQTLRNLRFLLQHESDFSVLPPLGPHGVHHAHLYGSGTKAQQAHTQMGGLRVDKYFVLNRIAEPELVSAIIGLLHMYSVPDSRIIIIPFDWDEYQRREFRWDGGVEHARGWGIGDGSAPTKKKPTWTQVPDNVQIPGDLSVLLEEADGDEARAMVDALQAKKRKAETLGRLRALDFTFHEKNLYAMNNNGGRNFALRHGRSLPDARWILPLDGNSFFTPAAMFSVVRTLSIAGEGPAASRYVVIPMARLTDNEDVRKNNTIDFVPLDIEEGASAIVDAEIFHRPANAPDTPEEPQIGFRYDSTESFQEAMRYGRRSKLEFLWRLGAIPYSRGLDRRTLPWEVTDRAHITAKTWGSIPGVEGSGTKDSLIHAPHGEHDPWGEPNPPRGHLAYVKAGWVYRLFSGFKSQEEHSTEAATLRNTQRIRGIVAFLERLDELVARGEHGCFGEENPFHCGFHPDRLWNFDMFDVERLRQKFKLNRRDAVAKIERFERLVVPTLRDVRHVLQDPAAFRDLHAQKAATGASLLAMAGYLTGNSSYSNAAAELIAERFIRRTPLFYHRVSEQEQLTRKGQEDAAEIASLDDREVNGYAFPPFPKVPGQPGTWSASLGLKLSEPDAPSLPFDPMAFDPLLLLDAVRLLNHPSGPKLEKGSIASRKAITPMVNSHLSFLLFAPEALDFAQSPPSPDDGAFYDAKVAALAAFLDDARLVNRVANRARLRLPSEMRAEGLMHPGGAVREIHFRLIQGLYNTKVRPYNMVSDEISQAMYVTRAHGTETPLDVLGL